MISLSPEAEFFLSLTKAQSVLSRRLDARLGGIGLSWFMIMFHLSQAPEEKMRRTDLADKVGLTASGITRLLLPMEKIGLVKSEGSEHDARVRFIALAPGGKAKLTDAIEDMELLVDEHVPAGQRRKLADMSAFLDGLATSLK